MRQLLLASVALLALAGCGNKGALYLPPEADQTTDQKTPTATPEPVSSPTPAA